MDEKIMELAGQYDIEVQNSYRGRGMYVFETTNGIRILKEYHSSAGKLLDEQQYKEYLIEHGFSKVDRYVRNKAGSYFIQDRYHVVYVMKEYFKGNECNVRNRKELFEAGENLGSLHKVSRDYDASKRLQAKYRYLPEVMQKKNVQMRRVEHYLNALGQKQDYERQFLRCFPRFFTQAYHAMQEWTTVDESSFQPSMCHGDYNQHNLLSTEQGWATVNFDSFSYDCQMLDLHYFLRKALEKNHFRMDVACEVLCGYTKVCTMTRSDFRLLYGLLVYPDKFYKLCNHYINGKKGWIAPKRIEKLNCLLEQEEDKQKFLEEFKQEYL
ncbi:MAG: phosphotransferase [Lachnospiraceae bacterium]